MIGAPTPFNARVVGSESLAKSIGRLASRVSGAIFQRPTSSTKSFMYAPGRPAKDGTFTVTVQVGNGIEIIETHAIDRAGNDVRDVRAVLAGSLGPTDGTQAAGIGARAGVTALRAVGNAIAVGAKAIDYNAAAKAANPIYNDTGCLGATVNITSVTLSNVGVALAPKAGALSTDVVIDNLVVKLAANPAVGCPDLVRLVVRAQMRMVSPAARGASPSNSVPALGAGLATAMGSHGTSLLLVYSEVDAPGSADVRHAPVTGGTEGGAQGVLQSAGCRIPVATSSTGCCGSRHSAW